MVAGTVALGGCGASDATGPVRAGVGTIRVVAGQSQYGNVAAQIGGRFVAVTSVESNPTTDPHSYEVSPGVAAEISGAQIVIVNGLGYDDFMGRIEAASPSADRRDLNVQHLLGLPDSTPNPHLWYDPTTMPAVADRLANELSTIQPSHSAYFHANAATFVASLDPWRAAIAAFKARYGGTTAATTEPVADYLLAAMGIDNRTPYRFQADVMNGTDPSPQDISLVDGLLTGRQVKVFCYNQQVTDPLTSSVRQAAQRSGVPIVGVYETMPTPGYDYQSWMLSEVTAIQDAVVHGVSTDHL